MQSYYIVLGLDVLYAKYNKKYQVINNSSFYSLFFSLLGMVFKINDIVFVDVALTLWWILKISVRITSLDPHPNPKQNLVIFIGKEDFPPKMTFYRNRKYIERITYIAFRNYPNIRKALILANNKSLAGYITIFIRTKFKYNYKK